MQMQTDAAGLPSNATMIPQGDDKGLVVSFFSKAEQNNYQSSQQGRPIFDEVVFIKILVPGDRTKTVERPMRDSDKERFPGAYAAYERRAPASLAGTPIDQWPRLSVTQVAEAKAYNIFTVENIAQLTDTAVSAMGMGWRELRAEAAGFIAKAADQAATQHLARQLEERDEKIDRQAQLIADLSARLDKMADAKGSKSKAATAEATHG